MESTAVLLIVDDEPGVLRLARDVLSRAGYHVLTARGPDQALQTCREHDGTIHLVLLDVILPDTPGLELFPLLSELRPTLKVVFMGGYPSELVIGSKMEGATFVQKPFQPSQLVDAVKRALSSA